ncbi:33 kDa inner dynein arm light chain, axonemal [Histomonas meleagridis]|uniref:33 kDa inner dynein arm light chain, axonemal n=1 Tax=Histomonas meleagridis TaxID=135588 RepID=UPI003559C4EE|nr:33 kDa inner dynein arm light chain, axonemal [Histomonas meleagridis]KAH0800127.1 33 kDa inner dynein arm light chain, axonemal [Histomonas meleagridis]
MKEKTKETLLKYDVPVLAASAMKKTKKTEQTSDSLTRDVLNSILPPREFTENGQDYIQYVSSTPASRTDVIHLQQELEKMISQRKARESGICPVRSQIYGQCFDEIIRQVTIDCSARGLLLVRVRDELRITIAAYQALYESAITWGMKKATQVEQGKDEVEAENIKLKEEKSQLELKAAELQAKIESIEKREEDYRIQKEKEHADEVSFLKRQTAQLKAQLEQMLAAK